jgi:hypothetical protein
MPEANLNDTTTRRTLLKGLGVYPVVAASLVGGTAIAGAVTANMAVVADPVPGLINGYRKAEAAHLAALAEDERSVGPTPSDEASLACYRHNEAFQALLETNPTTLAGAIALLSFLQELTVTDDWLFDGEPSDYFIPFIKNLAHALPRLSSGERI